LLTVDCFVSCGEGVETSRLSYRLIPVPTILIVAIAPFLSEPGVTVTCGKNNMTVSLEKQTFHFFEASKLRLFYSSCRYVPQFFNFVLAFVVIILLVRLMKRKQLWSNAMLHSYFLSLLSLKWTGLRRLTEK